MEYYRFYGLNVASEMPLPEADRATENAVADIHIRLGDVPAAGIPGAIELEEGCQATADDFWLSVADTARYRVRAGKEIIVDRQPGADDASVRLFLLGSSLGALLMQRGLLVLHGNAIRIGDACLVCVGDSGAGKSTLAAAFALQGHEVLADDVVAVDSQGRALPGLPRVKLWQDAADQLGISTAELRRIRPELEKFDWPLADRFCRQALPIRWICVIAPAEGAEPTVEAVEGFDRLPLLRDNSYRLHFLAGMSHLQGHFRQCADLLAQARMAILRRPEAYSPVAIATLVASHANSTQ